MIFSLDMYYPHRRFQTAIKIIAQCFYAREFQIPPVLTIHKWCKSRCCDVFVSVLTRDTALIEPAVEWCPGPDSNRHRVAPEGF